MSTWTNWGGNVTATPSRVEAPTSTEEVVALVEAARTAGGRLRPVGSGHSFTAIAAPTDAQVRFDGLGGVIDVDQTLRRVRVGAEGELLSAFGEDDLHDQSVQIVAQRFAARAERARADPTGDRRAEGTRKIVDAARAGRQPVGR